MTLYMIRGDTVTAYASPPARGSEDELRVRSAKEIEASRLTNAQMVAIWNALPGTAPVAKFKDRTRQCGGSGRLSANCRLLQRRTAVRQDRARARSRPGSSGCCNGRKEQPLTRSPAQWGGSATRSGASSPER